MTTTASIDFETKVQLVQIGVRKYNDTVFSAPSEHESADHVVTVNPETGLADYCTCKWYAKGGWTRQLKDGSCHKCAHALAVEAYIREERAAQEAPAQVAVEEVDVVAQAEEVAAQAEQQHERAIAAKRDAAFAREARAFSRGSGGRTVCDRGAFSLYR